MTFPRLSPAASNQACQERAGWSTASMELTAKPINGGYGLMSANLYDIPVRRIDGKEASLADYKGKVMLIVNVASKCGLTPQYADLEKVYENYRDKGLVVLGFPANEFAGQEPGSN